MAKYHALVLNKTHVWMIIRAINTTDVASAASNEGVKNGKNDTAPGIASDGLPETAAAAFSAMLVLSAAPAISTADGDDDMMGGNTGIPAMASSKKKGAIQESDSQ